jgi:hypothetical protein
MDPELNAVFKLPFEEQEKFFRGKINIPTLKWNDLVKDQHAKGFMVAGAYRDDILSDFREAVGSAIEKGTTLEEFQNSFDEIVKRHGWTYNGSRNWRSEIIFSTNIRTSYAAGRWAQLTDPDQLKIMPYLTYRHGDSRVPRPTHLEWDGVTLPHDDPWWDTHYVPNGWGCKCRVTGATRKDYEKAKAAGKGTAPPSPIDPETGAPAGIDKGWDYNVGKAAFGKSWVKETGKMKELGPWRKEQYPFLPKQLKGELPAVDLGDICKTESQLRKAVPEGIYPDVTGEPVNVTQAIADHILENKKRWDGRERYFPLIPDVISHAQEVWVGFIQAVNSGRVYLRRRYVKAYQYEKGRVAGVIADAVKGQIMAFDMIRSKDMSGGRLRSGRLIYPTK